MDDLPLQSPVFDIPALRRRFAIPDIYHDVWFACADLGFLEQQMSREVLEGEYGNSMPSITCSMW